MIKRHWEDWSNKRLGLEWLKAGLDPWHFLTQFTYTTDPHDPSQPVKIYPPKSFLEFLVSQWVLHDRLLVPKSRQMLVSWTMVGLHLWLTMFGRGRSVYFQSAKEEKADKLIQRAYFIWKLLPGCKPQAVYTYCHLKFPDLDSVIEGVPQGRDTIRQETCSAIFSDEQGFQEEAALSYIAAKPTIDGKEGQRGRYTGVSSANGPNFFKRLTFDEE